MIDFRLVTTTAWYNIITYSIIELILGWLQPLLDVIARDPTHVVSPMIANIIDETFQLKFSHHKLSAGYRFFVGGFDWGLQVSLLSLVH